MLKFVNCATFYLLAIFASNKLFGLDAAILYAFLKNMRVNICPNAMDYYSGVYGSQENNSHYETSPQDRSYAGIKYFDFLFRNGSNTEPLYGKGVQPYADSLSPTREELITNSTYGCNKEASTERAYCTKLIQLNGWKIPDDYFYRF